jgi:DNA-binding NarL/FixJ family response regulator
MSIAETNQRTVLIADDHHLVGEAFSQFLSAVGTYVPTLARDVLEAKAEILASGPFDLILLDLYMPGMEGPETISEIVRLNKGGRVVVLTGGNNRFRQSAIFAAGASGLVLKSQPAKQIVAALESVLDGEIYFPLSDDRHLDRVMAQAV